MRAVADTGVIVDAVAAAGADAWVPKRVVEDGVAPDIALGEVYAVLRSRFLQGRLDHVRFSVAVDALRTAPLELHPSNELLPRMAELVHSVSAYDAAFVALAEALDLPLVTKDRRLEAAHGPRCEIRLLS